MVTRERLDAKRNQYRELRELADSLLNRIEETWLGCWPDAPWQVSSTRAMDAAEEVGRHLQRILNDTYWMKASDD
jgi:hypothetical protein